MIFPMKKIIFLLNLLFVFPFTYFFSFLIKDFKWYGTYQTFSSYIHHYVSEQMFAHVFFAINCLLFFALIWSYCFSKAKTKKNINKYKKLTIEQLKKMDWQEYEELVKLIFQQKGFSVSRIGGNGADGGIDLIVRKKLTKSMVQCKRYRSNVGVKIVREMFAVGIHHNFNHVYIYTSADFTKEAVAFAKNKNMTLVNGQQMLREVRKIK